MPHNSLIMKYLLTLLSLALLACTLQAQQTSQSSAADNKSVDKLKVDAALQQYLAAYQHRSIDLLLEVWPDLQKDKKQYSQIKHHLGDASLADEKMEVTPEEVQPITDGAVVHAKRVESYSKVEITSTSYMGDTRGYTNAGLQIPGPLKEEKKKPITKQDEVWITLHHTGDTWTIASISDKRPM